MNQNWNEKLGSAIWNGKTVTGEQWWYNHLEQLLKEGITRESLVTLLLDLDMDLSDSLYVDTDEEE